MTTSTVKITADVAEFLRNVKTAEGQLNIFDSGMGRLRGNVLALASSFVAAAGVGGMGMLISRSMQLRDEQAKLADRLGITTERVAALSLQAELTGGGAEKFEASLQKMVARLQEAAVNGGPAASAVEKLGVNIFELASQRPDEAFFAISDAMKHVASETERLKIVTDIFGESGADLVAMLDEGRDGFYAAAEATRDFGTAISRVDAEKLEAANDAFTLMKESVDGLATRISIKLSPMLQQMAENFAHNTTALARFFGLRTEEEELQELLQRRAAIMERIKQLEENAGGETGHSRMLRNNANLLRDEINEILNKQKAEATAAIERDRQQQAEQQILKKKLEQDALEKELDKNKKQRMRDELEEWQRLQDIRSDSLDEMIAEELANAEAEQAIIDMRVAGKNNELENIRQINELMIESEKNKNEYISREQQAELDAQIARGEAAFSTMLGNVASHNKTFFKIQKLYRMSKLAMEAPAAVADSYAWGASWGGPPAGAAMAAIAGAAMVAYAGALASAQYGGGASSGSVSAAGGSANPVTSPITPGATSVVNPPAQREGSLTIIFNGPTNEQFVRDQVIPLIQGDIQERDLVLIRNDSRNGQQLQNV